ncbi:MAG TPA: hypothetical protein PLP71_00920 [Syntrophomonadaceae bacterium]|jgi:hypothetical protein|nr:hypothetical protein [Bacillota bacterium]HQA49656.1 hypothetical protein [Syntrophomonadaceae bacterium]HQD89558.1 hypothetical protein [Syntrophomonadaceae bacterium]
MLTSNLRRIVGYFVYVIAFGSFVIAAEQLQRYLTNLFSRTYDPTYFWTFLSIYPILVGVLLALPRLAELFGPKGAWKVDWIPLLVVGFPSLLVAMTPIICLAEFAQTWRITSLIFMYTPNLTYVAGILFGFVLVSSLGKQKSA